MPWRGGGGGIVLSIGKEELLIPDNLYIIATMNTADRSLSNMDYAIHRRFSFVNVYSEEPKHLEDGTCFAKNCYQEVSDLFKLKSRVSESKARGILVNGIDPEEIMLGPSYFLFKSADHLDYRLRYEVYPILKEYYKDGFFRKKMIVPMENGNSGSITVQELLRTEERFLDYFQNSISEDKKNAQQNNRRGNFRNGAYSNNGKWKM